MRVEAYLQGKEYKERKDKDPNIEPGSKGGEVRKDRGYRIQNPSSVSLAEVKRMRYQHYHSLQRD